MKKSLFVLAVTTILLSLTSLSTAFAQERVAPMPNDPLFECPSGYEADGFHCAGGPDLMFFEAAVKLDFRIKLHKYWAIRLRGEGQLELDFSHGYIFHGFGGAGVDLTLPTIEAGLNVGYANINTNHFLQIGWEFTWHAYKDVVSFRFGGDIFPNLDKGLGVYYRGQYRMVMHTVLREPVPKLVHLRSTAKKPSTKPTTKPAKKPIKKPLGKAVGLFNWGLHLEHSTFSLNVIDFGLFGEVQFGWFYLFAQATGGAKWNNKIRSHIRIRVGIGLRKLFPKHHQF